MEGVNHENSQFGLKNDIFSQFDDNFVTDDYLKSYQNSIGSSDVQMCEGNMFL